MNIDLYLLDTKLFDWINGLAFKWYWLDFTGFIIAKYSEYFLVVILFLFLAIYPFKYLLEVISPKAKLFNGVNFKKYWRIILEAIIAAAFTRFVLVETIRWLWFRPRPFVINSVNLLGDYNAKEASFPSGHASFYFALSTIVYFYNKKIGIIFYIASLCIVLARIFVGIHWPSDVLAGAIVGILVGLAFNKIFKDFK